MQTEFARAQMISQQIRAWDVLDERVLDAMPRTPREFFVPEKYAGLAFWRDPKGSAAWRITVQSEGEARAATIPLAP